MKYIERRVMVQNRMSSKGDYKLYSYSVIDDIGNKETVDTLQEYEKGQRVEVWFDPKWNKTKMRPYKTIDK